MDPRLHCSSSFAWTGLLSPRGHKGRGEMIKKWEAGIAEFGTQNAAPNTSTFQSQVCVRTSIGGAAPLQVNTRLSFFQTPRPFTSKPQLLAPPLFLRLLKSLNLFFFAIYIPRFHFPCIELTIDLFPCVFPAFICYLMAFFKHFICSTFFLSFIYPFLLCVLADL